MHTWTLPGAHDIESRQFELLGQEIRATLHFKDPEKKDGSYTQALDKILDVRARWYRSELWAEPDASVFQEFFRELSAVVDASGLGEGALRHKLFWDNWEPAAFRPFNLQGHAHELQVDKKGARWYFLMHDGSKKLVEKQTLACLWLNGPFYPVPDYAARHSIVDRIFEGLKGSGRIEKEEAFPLFHYGNFTSKRWEYDVEGDNGSFLEMTPQALQLGGWDKHHGGLAEWTYEHFYNRIERITKLPANVKKALFKKLEAAKRAPARRKAPAPKTPEPERPTSPLVIGAGPFGQPLPKKNKADSETALPAEAALPNCRICKHLDTHEYAFYKYGWEDDTHNLPAAAKKLIAYKAELKQQRGKRIRYVPPLKICPVCGRLYTWKESYEFLVNGSEDSIEVTRLSDAEVKEVLSKTAFDAWKKLRKKGK